MAAAAFFFSFLPAAGATGSITSLSCVKGAGHSEWVTESQCERIRASDYQQGWMHRK